MKNERYMADCREMGGTCTVTIAGTKDEVMKVAARHAVEDHGYKMGPDLTKQIKNTLKAA